MTTGQFISRGPYPGPDGKPVWLVVGIVLDPEHKLLKSETQFTLIPGALEQALVNPTDVSKHTRGCGVDGMVKLPIWRV